ILRGDKNEKAAASLELSLELSALMLTLSGASDSRDNALKKLEEVLSSGAALEKFRENLIAQGGDSAICDDPQKLLDNSLTVVPVKATESGYLHSIDTIAVGSAVCDIGGGRIKAEDSVDHAVGYLQEAKIGDKITAGDTLGVVYCRSDAQADLIY